MEELLRARLLLLLPTHTYRADGFVDATKRLGVELTVASEVPSALEEGQGQGHATELLTLELDNPEAAVAATIAFAKRCPISAVIGPDDDTVVLAAILSSELGLAANPVSAVQAARSKILQRERLRDSGVPVPDFRVHSLGADPGAAASAAPYPCVLKPISLSASRGVIRANDPDEFLAAHARLRAILESEAADGGGGSQVKDQQYLVERYVPGPEYAVEGLIVDGGLHILAVFDKPDPLEGPFFEETIYVTPSRADSRVQNSLVDATGRAATALGLVTGPVHAELRYSDGGPWLIELAARPIGGKCSRVLRFGDESEYSLEDVIVGHTVGVMREIPPREECAAGVMMIPIPAAGTLEKVTGVEAAEAEPGVEEVLITAHRGQELVPLPEGSRYLGFIFARADTPELVESSLRRAHEKLEIRVSGKQ
ncbi:MAG: ATP-grasp domain-containing protein [Gemmatimonadetes bacterium]|nr:ATP-grasp domain-containing protein [Gemmatimonadota bacterium]